MHRYCLQDRNFIIIFAIVRSLCVWFCGFKTMNLSELSILSSVKLIVSFSLSALRERGWRSWLCLWNRFKYVQLLSAGSYHVTCLMGCSHVWPVTTPYVFAQTQKGRKGDSLHHSCIHAHLWTWACTQERKRKPHLWSPKNWCICHKSSQNDTESTSPCGI